ncbi:hypothetical protein ACFPN0_30360 [Kitasatospora cinereorecta]
MPDRPDVVTAVIHSGRRKPSSGFDAVHRLPWRGVRMDHCDRARAHHRVEIRRLKIVTFAAGRGLGAAAVIHSAGDLVRRTYRFWFHSQKGRERSRT